MSWLKELADDSANLKSAGRFRVLRDIVPQPDGRAVYQDKLYCNLSGNDYLGLAGDMTLRQKFYQQYAGDFSVPELALSSSSSRLLTGNSPLYRQLEETLSKLYHNRSALVFNSGYHANIGILPALAQKGDLILSDKLNHASIIDGLRLSNAEFRRYNHLDLEHLTKLLAANRAAYRRVFIVTESIFSMDGDLADLSGLVAIKEKFDAVLAVDEAHAVGVRGPGGAGLAAELGVADRVDLLIGTFGKALGSTGAYVITAPEVREYLINHMRSLIFTTGLPPVVLAWSDFALRQVSKMDSERAKLKRLGDRLRAILTSAGLKTDGNSQIVPLIIGEDRETEKVAQKFLDNGFLVFPIRPPTVPLHTSRLRFSLSAAISDHDIEEIGGLL